MALARSTRKSTTKTSKVGRKVTSSKLKKTSSKPVTAKATKPKLKGKTLLPVKKSIVKTSGIKRVASPIKVIDFIAGILKQATKAQKMAGSPADL